MISFISAPSEARAIVHIPQVLIHHLYGESGPNLASERVVAHLQRLGLRASPCRSLI